MIEWTRLCCPVDFSESSRVAMKMAARTARRFGAELTLVHVMPPPVTRALDVPASAAEVLAAAAHEAGQALERWSADAEQISGRPAAARILSGDPAAEVVRFARAERCDLIVLGTHGRTGVPRLLLGSVAEHVVRHAHCPVLVARDDLIARSELAEEAAQYSSR